MQKLFAAGRIPARSAVERIELALEYDTDKDGEPVKRVRHFRYLTDALEFATFHRKSISSWQLWEVVTYRGSVDCRYRLVECSDPYTGEPR